MIVTPIFGALAVSLAGRTWSYSPFTVVKCYPLLVSLAEAMTYCWEADLSSLALKACIFSLLTEPTHI